MGMQKQELEDDASVRKQLRTFANPHFLLRQKSGGLPALSGARKGREGGRGCHRLPDRGIISTIEIISSERREGTLQGQYR